MSRSRPYRNLEQPTKAKVRTRQPLTALDENERTDLRGSTFAIIRDRLDFSESVATHHSSTVATCWVNRGKREHLDEFQPSAI